MRKNWLLATMMLSIIILGGCSMKVAKETDTAKNTSMAVAVESAKEETKNQNESNTSQVQTKETAMGVYQKKPEPAATNGDRILFVGNSHIFTNDLPTIFYELALAGGHEVTVSDLTMGSYSLERFSDPHDEYGAVLAETLENEVWDFVILQENTNAAMSNNLEKSMLPYASKLDAMIKQAGGQTALLMTWTPKDGAGLFSKETVQAQLSKNYMAAAEKLDALLIPGGDIFLEAINQDSNLTLWGEDGQHPSVEGTYLAACSAYALLFQETPVGNPYLCDLDEKTAKILQEVAQDYTKNLS